LILVVALTLGAHSLWFKRLMGGPPDGGFEGPGRPRRGDVDYAHDSTLSLHEFRPELKFNGKLKLFPPGTKREITSEDFPAWGKYLMVAYPYPSSRAGYSLLAAIVTLPFPQEMFVRDFHRMAVANAIFNVLLAMMIFIYGFTVRGAWFGGLIPCLLVALDYSNIYNSYSYMSHTTSGLLAFFAALALLASSGKTGYLRFASAAFLLVMSGFASSHVVFQSATLGLLAWLRALAQADEVRKRVGLTLAGAVGAAVTPVYLVGVETILQFEKLGIPTYFPELRNYVAAVDDVVPTLQAWYVRLMLDVRIFSPFVVLAASAIVMGMIALGVRQGWEGTLSQCRSRVRDVHLGKAFKAFLVNPLSLLVVPLVAGLAYGSMHAIPVSRVMVPHLVLAEVLLGLLLVRMVSTNRLIGVSVTAIALLCALAGNELLCRASTAGVISLRKIPRHVFFIREGALVSELATEYNDRGGNWIVPGDRYRYINKRIHEFVSQVDRDWRAYFDDLQPGDYESAWLAFDAMELVTTYSSAARFWKVLTALDENLVTAETYRTDFRLVGDLFKLLQEGALGEHAAFGVRRFAWNFGTWDQEYNYSLGYLGGIRPMLADTALATIDLRSIYYFNLGAVRAAVAARRDTP